MAVQTRARRKRSRVVLEAGSPEAVALVRGFIRQQERIRTGADDLSRALRRLERRKRPRLV